VILYQLDLQTRFGGAETFAAFCCRGLSALGVSTKLLVSPEAQFWTDLPLAADTELVYVHSIPELIACFRDSQESIWLLTHGPLPSELRKPTPGRLTTGFAHMPMQGRDPVSAFGGYDLIFPVSNWVRESLLAHQLPSWPQPLYGVADMHQSPVVNDIVCKSRYDWDQRKGRDRIYGALEPIYTSLQPLFKQQQFAKRPSLTLGIVSRLTPIKQFPLMFEILAPLLAKYPHINLEIFGSGGYASVRDLDAALQPCAGQVRFWGQQRDVAAIYPQLDYLLSGLPEKEALGLNIIEAQACGTPVIAVDAPPFTETVIDGVTGFLYRDPRQDAGADFARLLDAILAGRPRPQPMLAKEHLAKFSFEAFVERLRPVVAEVEAQLSRR
jgi:glycosyltransferase involved in cell wall biosynthesis